MGVVMTIILFSGIAAMNIWCSFMLIDVINYKKTHVTAPIIIHGIEIKVYAEKD